MSDGPKVIALGTGPNSLRSAAHLAFAGHAVRLLGLPDSALGGSHPDLPMFAAFADLKNQWVGPSTQPCPTGAAWLRGGDLHHSLQRRSGLGSRAVGFLQRLGEVPESAESWCRRHYSNWRLALGVLDGPWGEAALQRNAADALNLLAADRRWFAGDAESWRRQGIVSSGGEVLDDVDVLEIEIRNSRVVALETDFGREWVESAVFFDVPIHRLVAWLPNPLSKVLARPAMAVHAVRRAQALVRVDHCRLPERVMVGDGQGVWQARPIRTSGRGSTHVVVDLRLSRDSDARDEAETLLGQFLEIYADQIAGYGEPQLRIWEEDVYVNRDRLLIERLNELGLFHAAQVEGWVRRRPMDRTTSK